MRAEAVSRNVALATAISAHTANAFHIIPQFEEEFCTSAFLNDVSVGRFTFAGQTHDLGWPVDWLNNPADDIEWHILLHKFYFAPGLARRYWETGDEQLPTLFEALVSSWIAQTPVDHIAADVSARRVQNLAYAWYLFRQHGATFSCGFISRLHASIKQQVAHVIADMAPERNHRTLELYAVLVAGLAFDDIDAAGYWRQLAVQGLIDNIDIDLLVDGVHCELATDYHHIVLRSYLMFLRLGKANGLKIPSASYRKVERALDFAMHIHRPDGAIPALSDSDSRDYRELLSWGALLFGRQDLLFAATGGRRGTPPATRNCWFSTGGYAVLRSAWKSDESYADARYLVFDCGPVGAGNHGHLDALSIEVAAYGKPLVVDPGRYTYHEGGHYNWRAHFRGTAAHNTVQVDGLEQAVYRFKGKRMKIGWPLPRTSMVTALLDGDVPYLHGRTVSPNYLAVHDREIWFPDSRYWVLHDRMTSDAVHDYTHRLQLMPEAQGNFALRAHGNATEIAVPQLSIVTLAAIDNVTIEQGAVSTLYGIKQAAPRIAVSASGDTLDFFTLLIPWRDRPPGIEVCETGNGRYEVHVADDTFAHYWHCDTTRGHISGVCAHWRVHGGIGNV
ncbi:MAG: alginate lyase family protein [Gammaproteobacteria bacterium]|nr:alginate lyase family protein [Gammaproteobacteria bacterium]